MNRYEVQVIYTTIVEAEGEDSAFRKAKEKIKQNIKNGGEDHVELWQVDRLVTSDEDWEGFE